MIGEERFITAIITQAVEDAAYIGNSKKMLKHKVNAIDWLLNEDNENYETFLNYCTMLGLSPSRIQEKVKLLTYLLLQQQMILLVKQVCK